MTDEPQEGRIILYQEDGRNVPVEVTYLKETFWLTQQKMAELFNTTTSNISMHLKNIFEAGELDETSCLIKFRISEFNKKPTNFYNLDAIIAVGYRVNSKQATRFRQWATGILREYIIKGFAINDDMLKNGRPFGDDYFEELLDRIRDIRTSERRFWQKITDLFSEVSYDYDPNSRTARDFFASCQNKMHYAVTSRTAAEIVMERVDAGKPNMGLTTWKGAPKGHPRSTDVVVAKNYLNEREMKALNTLTTGLLDLVETRVLNHRLTSMEECATLIDQYITLSGMPLLEGKGNRGHEQMKRKALDEFRKWDAARESDFDRFAKGLDGSGR
ncbi:virulence RhuM family protein [Bifidobacterium dentium]|uniref:RhuM family protein n=1 Tax=Bifidobacterium dentium TaxID=1689 RepID=UPI0018C26D70|nr:RhuM family protein [Bifidobacterium dentium]MBF9696545.1 virulence RhuM family protein [Bifidobacterium dentium]MBF9712705.1 virulence RhuM family protein [Bifidobacterium dentium]MBF9714666.1 virulence RhuM family protein [Bifidobacterium dentium]MBF9718638.1 virulence RhuM family protein [Bifidobacterium dentium]